MLKLAKWAYNRGVQFERMRIKKLITDFSQETHQLDRMYRGKDENDRSERAKRELELHVEANRLLMRLMDPDYNNQQMMVPGPPPIEGADNA